MYQIEIRHNFETAHRLAAPGSPVKCMSIHGHSWWATVTIEGPRLGPDGILVEFGAFKAALRRWMDDHLDHHLVLQRDDPMAEAVRSVYPESRLLLLDQSPTTEVMAHYLFEQATRILQQLAYPGPEARIVGVHVQETAVNAAAFRSAP